MVYVFKMLYTLCVKKIVLGFFFRYSDICVGGIFFCFIRKRNIIKICRAFHDQEKKIIALEEHKTHSVTATATSLCECLYIWNST
jgi:hypothetical protein